jgi:MoxR-like ATPase
MRVNQRIAALLARLAEGVYEKEEELALALLSSLAGESVFLLGPPGVAKSLVARRLKFAYKGAKSFEYLMSRFSTPDEIFGPVSISRLKDSDRYERLTQNYLPSAEVVFLDEIWKAGPSIQNALLTVLNEKVYRNGEEEIHVPIKALVSASNELPEKGHGLEALWDRFLVRLYVHGVRNKDSFHAMICATHSAYEDSVPEAHKICDGEYRAWSREIDAVSVPENILDVIEAVRSRAVQPEHGEKAARGGMYISDRRWRKIVRLLRASAFFNGRSEVDLMDCFLIKHCIWSQTDEIEDASRIVHEAVGAHGYLAPLRLRETKDELAAFRREVEDSTHIGEHKEASPTASPADGGVLPGGGADYYELAGYPNAHNELLSHAIAGEDFSRLDTEARILRLYYRHRATGKIMHTQAVRMAKAQAASHVIINGGEYEVKFPAGAAPEKRKPPSGLEEAWDKRIQAFLGRAREMRETLCGLRARRAAGSGEHLFVPKEAQGVVEAHLDMLRKETEKLEIEIRGLRNSYKKIGAPGARLREKEAPANQYG